MGEHISLDVDRLIVGSSAGAAMDLTKCGEIIGLVSDTKASSADLEAGSQAECRICQEEDDVMNLETPCACSGSMKYAHRKCVQHWCNEKGDIVCEICHHVYVNGYTAPWPKQTNILSVGFTVGPDPLPHFRAMTIMAPAERHLFDAEYDEYEYAATTACCHSFALILMALVFVRHVFVMVAKEPNENIIRLFSLVFLGVAVFLLSCYIMARTIYILRRGRERQQAAMAVAEDAMIFPHHALNQANQRGRPMTFAVSSQPAPLHELP